MSICVYCATSTLTFTSACSGSGTANDGTIWTVTSDADESNYESDRGIHYGTSKKAVSYLRLTTSDISGTITQIIVNASGASSTSAKLAITVGGNSFGTQQSLTSTATPYTFTGSSSGEIFMNITQTSAKRALYCKSISVTYSGGLTTCTVNWIANGDTVYKENNVIHNTKVDTVHHIHQIELAQEKQNHLIQVHQEEI